MLSNAAPGGAAAAAGGGDTHVHFNVSALDAGSVRNWLSNNSHQIMKAMDQAVKNGDHLGLAPPGDDISMAQVFGVCLLPATGEFAYDAIPAQGARWNPTGGVGGGGALESMSSINCYYAPGGTKTDYSYALDQLQAEHPECQTVALVVAWFGNSTDAASCQIYPSTTFIEGEFDLWTGISLVGGTTGNVRASPRLRLG